MGAGYLHQFENVAVARFSISGLLCFKTEEEKSSALVVASSSLQRSDSQASLLSESRRGASTLGRRQPSRDRRQLQAKSSGGRGGGGDDPSQQASAAAFQRSRIPVLVRGRSESPKRPDYLRTSAKIRAAKSHESLQLSGAAGEYFADEDIKGGHHRWGRRPTGFARVRRHDCSNHSNSSHLLKTMPNFGAVARRRQITAESASLMDNTSIASYNTTASNQYYMQQQQQHFSNNHNANAGRMMAPSRATMRNLLMQTSTKKVADAEAAVGSPKTVCGFVGSSSVVSAEKNYRQNKAFEERMKKKRQVWEERNQKIAEKKLELRYLRDERRLAELRKNELIKSITTMQDQLNRRRTELNHKISCMRLEHEIGDLRKRLENMRLRLDAEIRIKDQAELEVREIRNEISDKKRMLNEILAAMKRAGASESHILLLPSSSLATPSNGPKMNGHKSANHHQYVLEMTSRIDSNWRHGKRRTIPSKSLSNLASLPSDA
ncbi:unnamed protein product [Notodromas monacha]|uniref:Spermatogenesis-associated protein 1 C-terminal domain-containing protein n=1 Tax=Notodromas monacha TaxID=399045 RepID=A0A7R9GCT1_9CRUS|nr:unnamed protein product [Notodromas monacha]CAG0916425.1 unnamed protein product [Notodromas monacha]